jgi:hypothetical protein
VLYDSSVDARLDETLYEAKPERVLESWRGVVVYVAERPPLWLKAALSGTDFDLE